MALNRYIEENDLDGLKIYLAQNNIDINNTDANGVLMLALRLYCELSLNPPQPPSEAELARPGSQLLVQNFPQKFIEYQNQLQDKFKFIENLLLLDNIDFSRVLEPLNKLVTETLIRKDDNIRNKILKLFEENKIRKQAKALQGQAQGDLDQLKILIANDSTDDVQRLLQNGLVPSQDTFSKVNPATSKTDGKETVRLLIAYGAADTLDINPYSMELAVRGVHDLLDDFLRKKENIILNAIKNNKKEMEIFLQKNPILTKYPFALPLLAAAYKATHDIETKEYLKKQFEHFIQNQNPYLNNITTSIDHYPNTFQKPALEEEKLPAKLSDEMAFYINDVIINKLNSEYERIWDIYIKGNKKGGEDVDRRLSALKSTIDGLSDISKQVANGEKNVDEALKKELENIIKKHIVQFDKNYSWASKFGRVLLNTLSVCTLFIPGVIKKYTTSTAGIWFRLQGKTDMAAKEALDKVNKAPGFQKK